MRIFKCMNVHIDLDSVSAVSDPEPSHPTDAARVCFYIYLKLHNEPLKLCLDVPPPHDEDEFYTDYPVRLQQTLDKVKTIQCELIRAWQTQHVKT